MLATQYIRTQFKSKILDSNKKFCVSLSDRTMADLPFTADYAKSGRSLCKGCREPISKGILRLATVVQSAWFNGKQANWYHEECFFLKYHPKSVADVGNVSALRHEDQEKIIKAVGETSLTFEDFVVEYSKSNRTTCKGCGIKIIKDEVRICKKHLPNTEIKQKFAVKPLRYHVGCFAKGRSNLMFLSCGDVLPGYDSLSEKDKTMIKNELPDVSQEMIQIKKLNEEPENIKQNEAFDNEELVLKNQNKLFYKHRDILEKYLYKNECKQLLAYNKQRIPVKEEKMLDLLADIMTFGALSPCQICKTGQLLLDTNGYVCSGNLTERSKCQATTQNPVRTPFKIENNLKYNIAFKGYKFKARTRIFRNIIQQPIVHNKIAKGLKKLKTEKPVPSLNSKDVV